MLFMVVPFKVGDIISPEKRYRVITGESPKKRIDSPKGAYSKRVTL